LTDNNNIYLAKDLASDTRHLLQMNDMDVARSTENPGLFIPPDAIASIFYTSGSTGEPKGVIQNHRNVLHRVMIDTNHFHICPEDRLSLLTSPGYSVSLRNLFDALLNGTVLCPFNVEAEGLAHLADWLIQEEITIYFSVPSVFHHAVDGSAKAVHMTTVRLIDLTGEPVTKEDIVLYKKFFPCHCILVNSLGSNEAGIVRRYFIDHDTEIRGNMVPVGYEIESKDVLLLDEFGDEVGINEMGQIAVKSRYLSPGYWRKPDLTQEVFLCSPEGSEERIYLTRDLGRLRPDGCLIHLGREDFQVKIRGQRIEVAEIEMALVDLEAIKEAVVVSRENRSGDRRLVAYLVPSKHPTPSIATLRRELALRLPDYMIPSLYMWVDQLPLTPNKKVDRRALPPPNESRPLLHTPFVAPRTPVEATIAKIWTEVLCLEQVGVHDNFFECGGHSLAAARIVSRVTKTFHLRLPLKALFDSPTVAEMAQVIIETQAELTEQRNLVQALSELESLSDEEAERLLASAREDKRESID
jgi:acyl-coenzyme A synthetase/AMP-(fatty) acid ligase/acyl carrier protein